MDWNNDGTLDILSGCYWSDGAQAAHIQMLAGLENGQYAEATPLLNAKGNPLANVPAKDKADEADDGDDINESDAETEEAGEEVEWNNICTHQHAVDYDGDGDLDLVTGNIGNTFFYTENIGSDETRELSDVPVQLEVTMPGGHSSPHLVDWDNDGDLDLLSGSSDGGAYLSENTGTRSAPVWAGFKTLIPGSKADTQAEREGPIVPAPSTRLWVVDWNQDGKLDVLAGDSVTISDPKAGLSEQEYEQAQQAYDDRIKAAQDAFQETSQAYYAAESSEAGASDEMTEKYQQAQQAFTKAWQSKGDFVDERRTGHVWLYLQM